MLDSPQLSFTNTPQPKQNPQEPQSAEMTELQLHAYPNPFNSLSTITFRLDDPGTARLSVFNLLGQEVRTLVDDWQLAGQYKVHWDGRNNWGEFVSSGVYIIKMQLVDNVYASKISYLK